ncbi:DUF1294 domain-containing protein [Ferrimonas gelatinilytica]|uniref:DUF1294 domain-containing protein n=1 Tax=Ferrimonas gelatinilytica TaxID=1255257 RepID=A0ABP9RXR2_9GAMM
MIGLALSLLWVLMLMLMGPLNMLPHYLAVSMITLLLFGLDKRRALTGARRVPEALLHGFELLGGWLGAFLGAQMFRHKVRKVEFMTRLYGITALHFLGYGGWLILA